MYKKYEECTRNLTKNSKNLQQKTSLRNLHKVGTKSIILPQNTVCIYCTSQLSQILETYLTPLKRSDEDEGHIKFKNPNSTDTVPLIPFTHKILVILNTKSLDTVPIISSHLESLR